MIIQNFKIVKNVQLILFLVAIFLLSACSQSGTDPVNPDTDNVTGKQIENRVSLYPEMYFVNGYVENYSFTGDDDKASVYTGSFQVATGEEEVFNGVNAVPIVNTLVYSTIINNAPSPITTIVLTQYYTATTPRQYLGSINDSTGLVFTIMGSAYDIPESVVANDFDILAVATGSDSSEEAITWAVSSIDSISSNLAIRFIHSDSAGGIINDETHTYSIDANGERTSWSLIANVPSLSNTIRLSGARI